MSMTFGYGSGGGVDEYGVQVLERARQGPGEPQWCGPGPEGEPAGYKVLLSDVPDTEEWSLSQVRLAMYRE